MEPRFEIRYTANKNMLREFYRKFGSGPRYPIAVMMAAVFTGLTLYSVCAGILTDVLPNLVGYGAFFLAIFFLPWYISWKALRASKRSNDGVMPETKVTVKEDSIDMDEGFVHLCLEYRKFCRVVHLKHSYVLMMSRRSGLMIDPDGFTKGTFAEFKQFLREKRPDLNIPE